MLDHSSSSPRKKVSPPISYGGTKDSFEATLQTHYSVADPIIQKHINSKFSLSLTSEKKIQVYV